MEVIGPNQMAWILKKIGSGINALPPGSLPRIELEVVHETLLKAALTDVAIQQKDAA